MNFSTRVLKISGIKSWGLKSSCMVEISGVDEFLSFLGFKSSCFNVNGFRIYHWKFWDWKIKGWSMGLKCHATKSQFAHTSHLMSTVKISWEIQLDSLVILMTLTFLTPYEIAYIWTQMVSIIFLRILISLFDINPQKLKSWQLTILLTLMPLK